MNFKNKFNATTKKFYIVLNADKGSEGEFLCLHNGSISDYFTDFTGLPLVMYAGKAIKAINRDIKKNINVIEQEKSAWWIERKRSEIAGWSIAVNELSAYKPYDLIGIYGEGDTFKIVDYKNIDTIVQSNLGYKFVEISKEIYIKLAAIENKISNNQKTTNNNEVGDCELAWIIGTLLILGFAACCMIVFLFKIFILTIKLTA